MENSERTVNIYWVRHAESEYNRKEGLLGNIKEVRQSLDLIDACITQKGVQQCEDSYIKNQEIFDSLDYILVSPMRRTLQTCKNIYKKSEKNIPKLIEPQIRVICVVSCDVGQNLKLTKQEFSEYDFQQMNGLNEAYWTAQLLTNSQQSQNIINEINIQCSNEQEQIEQQSQKIILDYIETNTAESQQDEKERLQDFYQNKLKNFLINNKQIKNLGIISHSTTMVALFQKKPDNCEILKTEYKL